MITAHPKLITLGIGLTLTLAIGTIIGMFDQSHMASAVGVNVPVATSCAACN